MADFTMALQELSRDQYNEDLSDDANAKKGSVNYETIAKTSSL